MEELINFYGASVDGNCMVSKAKLAFMNLLCSGLVGLGLGLQRNLGTAQKEHPYTSKM